MSIYVTSISRSEKQDSKARVNLVRAEEEAGDCYIIPHFHHFFPFNCHFAQSSLSYIIKLSVKYLSSFASVSVSELQREPWLKNPLPSSSPRTKLPPNSNPHPPPIPPSHHVRKPTQTLTAASPSERTPSPKCHPTTKTKPPAGANRTKNCRSNRRRPSKPTATNPPPPPKTRACSSRTKPCSNSSWPCGSSSRSSPRSKAAGSPPCGSRASWTGRRAKGRRIRV